MSIIKQVKPHLKIAGYKLLYTDMKSAARDKGTICGKTLYSAKHGLSGKPDFIFRKGNKLVPIELKSGRLNGADTPRHGDLMQLVAYFIIIKDEFGYKPRQGRLIYGDTMFIVKNRRKLRKMVLKTLEVMRSALEFGEPGGDTEQEYIKCRYCVCRRTVCKGVNT